jgi:transposase
VTSTATPAVPTACVCTSAPCSAETFIPLDHDPGQRLEADFGHIYADFPAGRRQVPVLLVTWSYSNCPFALALPTERTEAILHGLVEAFALFGCVPQELWLDNPKTVAIHICRGRERRGISPPVTACATGGLTPRRSPLADGTGGRTDERRSPVAPLPGAR